MNEVLEEIQEVSPKPPIEIETPWLLHDQAAAYIRRSPDGLRYLIRHGQGPPRKRVGGLWLYHIDWLNDWILECPDE